MEGEEIKKIIFKLSKTFKIFAPKRSEGVLRVSKIDHLEEIEWTNEIPANSWKEIFLPHFESLFVFKKDGVLPVKSETQLTACLGVNILDLKALTLFEQVFSEDSYYQERRRKIILVGYNSNWPIDYKSYKVFSYQFKENILEHLVFDIFFARCGHDKFKIFSGSERGQEILEAYGIKKYQHIEFNGAVSENGPDSRMKDLKQKMEKSFNRKIWKDLGEICLACGQCSIVCPTCFCFDFEDKSDPASTGRSRKWGNCFYNDFSKVAGGFKPLDSAKEKIYFWYTHKFVRIPKEYGLPGCVSCGRCSRVCPVGIKINEVLKKI